MTGGCVTVRDTHRKSGALASFMIVWPLLRTFRFILSATPFCSGVCGTVSSVAIPLEAQTINKEVIEVCSQNEFNQIIHFFFLKEIIKPQYQFVILGLDLIGGNLLRTLWKNEAFISNIN